MMDSEEWGGGAGNEDTNLVDGVVCGVKRAVSFERGGFDGEEERWCYALVYRVFGDVD